MDVKGAVNGDNVTGVATHPMGSCELRGISRHEIIKEAKMSESDLVNFEKNRISPLAIPHQFMARLIKILLVANTN